MTKFDLNAKTIEMPSGSPSRPPLPLGRERIGRYEVLYPLAQGGMASIHVGRLVGYAGFERLVAIKVIHPHLAGDASLGQMLLDEARLAGLIEHPNVCGVLEVGEDDGLLYLVSELIMGQNLRSLRYRAHNRDMPIPQTMMAHIGAEICAGLHRAHEQHDKKNRPLNLVHRDVTPRNVIVSYDGYVKLIDFGIALARGRLAETDPGHNKGKIGFMPPEQIHGTKLDRRTDIFALGVVLYQLAVGLHPFPGDYEAMRMQAVLSGAYTAPSEANPEIHPSFEKIIVKAMAHNLDDRYKDAQEMGRELQKFAFGVTGEAGIAAIRAMMQELFTFEITQDQARLRRYRSRSPKLHDSNGFQAGRPSAVRGPLVQKRATVKYAPQITQKQNFKILLATIAVLAVVLVGIFFTARALIAKNPPAPSLSPNTAPHNHAGPNSAPKPALINLVLKIKPPDARVELDGVVLPLGTLQTSVPKGKTDHILVISAPGHQTFERRFRAVADYQLIVDLAPRQTPNAEPPDSSSSEKDKEQGTLRSNPYDK